MSEVLPWQLQPVPAALPAARGQLSHRGVSQADHAGLHELRAGVRPGGGQLFAEELFGLEGREVPHLPAELQLGGREVCGPPVKVRLCGMSVIL